MITDYTMFKNIRYLNSGNFPLESDALLINVTEKMNYAKKKCISQNLRK